MREASTIDQQEDLCKKYPKVYYKRLYQGKMATLLLLLVTLVYGTSAVSIMPELKHNILQFGYRVNFRYEGMLAHLFDRFYVVTRIEIPTVSDLNFTVFQFDDNCSHVINIEKDTKFKVPSTIKDMFKVYCKILFHTCIYINIKWNIMKRYYITF